MKSVTIRCWILSGFLIIILGIMILSTNELGLAKDNLEASYINNATVVIPAAAFHSDGFDPDSARFRFDEGYLTGDPSGHGCVMAPVYLSHGAHITALRASVYDDDPSLNVSLFLKRVNLDTGANVIVASISTDSVSTDIQNLYNDIPDSIVSPLDAYYVVTCISSADLRLYSVIIYYAYPVYLPYIQR